MSNRFDWVPIHPEGKEWVMWDDDRQTFLGSVSTHKVGNYPSFHTTTMYGSNVMGDTGTHASMREAAVTCQDYMTVRKGMLL